jgi:hypothetical protein
LRGVEAYARRERERGLIARGEIVLNQDEPPLSRLRIEAVKLQGKLRNGTAWIAR